MKDFFKNLFTKNSNTVYTGALIDDRTPDQKQNDIRFNEVVAAASPVPWQQKSAYRAFPKLNQWQTNQCGAFSGRKALGIMYSTYPRFGSYLDFSSSDIYKNRRSIAGMSFPEIFAAWERGVTLQALVNDSPMTDSDTDNITIPTWMHGVGSQFSVTNGIYAGNDIETIASIINTTGKGVILLTYFNSAEWSRYMPTVIDSSLQYSGLYTLRHFVVAVDFTMINGIKYLVVEDSAWFGGLNVRLLSESWLKARVIDSGYPMNFKFNESVGMTPSYDGATIVSAQKCLQFDGEFPSNVAFIENIGPITRKALIAFQTKYSFPQTGLIDDATKNKLHQLYP